MGKQERTEQKPKNYRSTPALAAIQRANAAGPHSGKRYSKSDRLGARDEIETALDEYEQTKREER